MTSSSTSTAPSLSHTSRGSSARLRVLLLALAAVLAIALLPASTADAAGKKTQRFSTTGLRASLTVDFKSKYEWTLQGWVKDVCPGDGRGVYMRDADGLRKTKNNGWKVVAGWFGQGSDTDGCGNGRTYISKRRMVQVAGNKVAFQALRIKVCAMDSVDDEQPLCTVRVWHNPYY